MKRKISFLLCCCAAAMLFSGCSPYKELKELSIVQGMGVDSGQNGGYNLTFQVLKSKTSNNSGSQSGGGGGENEVYVSSGTTLFDTIRNTTLQMGRKLYFPSTQIFVIGEEESKKNLVELFDFMQRNHDMRPTVKVYVSRGNANGILTATKNGSQIPAADIAEISKSYYNSSKTIDVTFSDIYMQLANGITDPVIPVISAANDNTGKSMVEMQGSAVFNKNVLAGYLDDSQTRGYLWIMGKAESGIVVVYPSAGGKVSLEVTKNKSDVKIAQDKNGQAIVKITIDVSSNMGEVQGTYSSMGMEYKQELIRLQAEVIKKEAQSAIDGALRAYNSDIFGFGMKIFQSKPDEWKKLSKNWDTDAHKIPVEITVKSEIRQRGIISK
ncbi:MAG TPA: Ger(x)C family spore germination protein [Clostridia bacterium]|nr:Ger(x)C family spore germination protein [Clostridia bacterium]